MGRGKRECTPLNTPLGPKAGAAYTGILELGGCNEGKIEDILYEPLLRGLSTRRVNRIRGSLWRSDIRPVNLSRRKKDVKEELIRLITSVWEQRRVSGGVQF